MTTSPVQNPETLAWTYPPSWTEDQRTQWEHTQGELAAVTQTMERAVAGSAAALSTPEALLSETRARVAEAQRATDRLRRSTAGALAWHAASAEHGANVTRLDSIEGDVILQLYMTPAEIDDANAAAQRLLDAARASVPANADAKARAEAEAAGRREYAAKQLDKIIAKCTVGGLGETESAARLRYLVGRYEGIGSALAHQRDQLVRGYRLAEEKDSAP